MSGLSGAACVGQGPLFESIEAADHLEAAAICGVCPAIEACRGLLETDRAIAPYAGGPVGTWAGELVGTTRKPREHGTERGYQQHRHYGEKRCGKCRSAHTAHVADTWTKAQVNPTNRTPVRVESEARRGPVRANGTDPLATVSTRPKGA